MRQLFSLLFVPSTASAWLIFMKNIAEIDKIQEICDNIVAVVNPLKVFLFGSFASGDYKESSDYDFFVVVSDKEKRRNIDIGRIIYAKTISLSDRSLDIIVRNFSTYERMKFSSMSVEGEVFKKGILLYEK